MTDVLRHRGGDSAAATWSLPQILGSADPALAAGQVPADPMTAAAELLAAAEGAGFLPRLQKTVDGMLALGSWEDSVALNQLLMTTVVGQYDTFLLNALETYADYVLEELERLMSFVADIGDTLNAGADLLACSGDYVLASVAGAVFGARLVGTPPSSLYDYCPQAREIVKTWDEINAFVGSLQGTLAKLRSGDAAERALDFLSEVVLAGAELFAEPKVKAYIYAFYQDAARLGQLVGTIAGFLMWQVIETVATAGIGKIKHTTKIGAAFKLAAEMAL